HNLDNRVLLSPEPHPKLVHQRPITTPRQPETACRSHCWKVDSELNKCSARRRACTFIRDGRHIRGGLILLLLALRTPANGVQQQCGLPGVMLSFRNSGVVYRGIVVVAGKPFSRATRV
ncbi:unnamed protein product, partial [Musa banksii]